MPALHGTTILAVRHQGVCANQQTENIGARRLATVLEAVLEDISFAAGEGGEQRVTVEAALVKERLAPLLQDRDLTRFIL